MHYFGYTYLLCMIFIRCSKSLIDAIHFYESKILWDQLLLVACNKNQVSLSGREGRKHVENESATQSESQSLQEIKNLRRKKYFSIGFHVEMKKDFRGIHCWNSHTSFDVERSVIRGCVSAQHVQSVCGAHIVCQKKWNLRTGAETASHCQFVVSSISILRRKPLMLRSFEEKSPKHTLIEMQFNHFCLAKTN